MSNKSVLIRHLIGLKMKIKIVFIALIATVMTLCLTGCINPAASNPAHGNQGNGGGNSENTLYPFE